MNLIHQLYATLKQHGVTPVRLKFARKGGVNAVEDKLLDQVLTFVWETAVVDEDEIARKFYGRDATRNNNGYKKIKQRLIDHLMDDVISLGLRSPKLNSLQRGFYSSHRDYVVAAILTGRGAKSVGAYFYRRALRNASKYDAAKIEMLAIYALRSHAASVEKNQRQFEALNVRYQQALRKVIASDEVAEYYHGLTIIYDASPKILADIHQRALHYLETLDGKYEVDSMGYLYAFAYFQLKMLCWYAVSNYGKTLEVADEALAYFENLSFDYPLQRAVFYLHKIVFYTLLKEFDLGITAYHNGQKCVMKGSLEWVKLQEAAFRLAVYGKRYATAGETYLLVTRSQIFSDLPDRRKERWLINRAYLYYLEDTGNINFTGFSDAAGPFKLGKFLNSLPKLDKQKEGNNIPILIISILFLIQEKKHLQAIGRIDAAEKYLTRYLKRGENYRSKCFIKILLQFAKSDFEIKEGLRRTRSWHAKLLAHPIEISHQSYEIEVIPYEDLYAILMGQPLSGRLSHE